MIIKKKRMPFSFLILNKGLLMIKSDNSHIKSNDKIITGIIVFLAFVLTGVSLAMIAVSSWERSASIIEGLIMTFLAGSIALSAHLLPALTKNRVGKIGLLVVSVLWGLSVLVTLYSHTVFFVSTGLHAGDIRAEKSTKVEDLQNSADKTKLIMENPRSRSIVDVTRDIASIEGRIATLKAQDCDRCKRIKAKIVEAEATGKALSIELQEANRIASLRDKAMAIEEKAMKIKDDARLDPVTEKLSGVFKGMNVDAITLLIAVSSSALLETLAALFWWLIWPHRKEEKINIKSVKEQTEKAKITEEPNKIKKNFTPNNMKPVAMSGHIQVSSFNKRKDAEEIKKIKEETQIKETVKKEDIAIIPQVKNEIVNNDLALSVSETKKEAVKVEKEFPKVDVKGPILNEEDFNEVFNIFPDENNKTQENTTTRNRNSKRVKLRRTEEE